MIRPPGGGSKVLAAGFKSHKVTLVSTPPPNPPERPASTFRPLQAPEVTTASERILNYPHLQTTVFWDSLRGACTGLVSASLREVVLVVAVLHFKAGQNAKALLSSANALGLLLTPLTLYFIARTGLNVSRASGLLLFGAAVGFAGALAADDFLVFMAGTTFAAVLIAGTLPLSTSIWRQNAPDDLRGQCFSRVSLLGIVAGLAGSSAISWWFDKASAAYVPVLAFFAAAMLLAGFFVMRIPSQPVRRSAGNPLGSLRYLWTDPLFGYMAGAWMLMGFANLMTVPLRVEYLVSDRYGLNYGPAEVLVIATVVPTFARLCSVMFWGRLFDRANFFAMRIVLNLFFLVSIVLFFVPVLWCQVAGALCMGIGNGGGEIVWNLWVTKFSKPERTAEYMSVHTFLTGLRGVAGPFLGFNLVAQVSIHYVSWSAAAMIGLSCLMLVRVLPLGRRDAGGGGDVAVE